MASAEESALLLSRQPDANGQVEMLVGTTILSALTPALPSSQDDQPHFSSWPIQMRYRGTVHTIVPQRVLEQDRDYLWIACRLEPGSQH